MSLLNYDNLMSFETLSEAKKLGFIVSNSHRKFDPLFKEHLCGLTLIEYSLN